MRHVCSGQIPQHSQNIENESKRMQRQKDREKMRSSLLDIAWLSHSRTHSTCLQNLENTCTRATQPAYIADELWVPFLLMSYWQWIVTRGNQIILFWGCHKHRNVSSSLHSCGSILDYAHTGLHGISNKNT